MPWPQRLLGAGRGLTHVEPRALPDPPESESGGSAGSGGFEEQLRASQPSDLTSLVLQLAEERNAFVARTILAARLPGWETVALADVTVTPL